ncbi:MAG TPA: hypothetical protein VKT49_26135 [Bryobacteraceae bacterium]|nr:hypothetical protein [Bryobacteraceae bacterium]
MNGRSDSPQDDAPKPRPGFGQQFAVTLAVLLGAGAVFGGIWLLDLVAH